MFKFPDCPWHRWAVTARKSANPKSLVFEENVLRQVLIAQFQYPSRSVIPGRILTEALSPAQCLEEEFTVSWIQRASGPLPHEW